eukprot:Rmarinus@m.15348
MKVDKRRTRRFLRELHWLVIRVCEKKFAGMLKLHKVGHLLPKKRKPLVVRVGDAALRLAGTEPNRPKRNNRRRRCIDGNTTDGNGNLRRTHLIANQANQDTWVGGGFDDANDTTDGPPDDGGGGGGAAVQSDATSAVSLNPLAQFDFDSASSDFLTPNRFENDPVTGPEDTQNPAGNANDSTAPTRATDVARQPHPEEEEPTPFLACGGGGAAVIGPVTTVVEHNDVQINMSHATSWPSAHVPSLRHSPKSILLDRRHTSSPPKRVRFADPVSDNVDVVLFNAENPPANGDELHKQHDARASSSPSTRVLAGTPRRASPALSAHGNLRVPNLSSDISGPKGGATDSLLNSSLLSGGGRPCRTGVLHTPILSNAVHVPSRGGVHSPRLTPQNPSQAAACAADADSSARKSPAASAARPNVRSHVADVRCHVADQTEASPATAASSKGTLFVPVLSNSPSTPKGGSQASGVHPQASAAAQEVTSSTSRALSSKSPRGLGGKRLLSLGRLRVPSLSSRSSDTSNGGAEETTETCVAKPGTAGGGGEEASVTLSPSRTSGSPDRTCTNDVEATSDRIRRMSLSPSKEKPRTAFLAEPCLDGSIASTATPTNAGAHVPSTPPMGDPHVTLSSPSAARGTTTRDDTKRMAPQSPSEPHVHTRADARTRAQMRPPASDLTLSSPTHATHTRSTSASSSPLPPSSSDVSSDVSSSNSARLPRESGERGMAAVETTESVENLVPNSLRMRARAALLKGSLSTPALRPPRPTSSTATTCSPHTSTPEETSSRPIPDTSRAQSARALIIAAPKSPSAVSLTTVASPSSSRSAPSSPLASRHATHVAGHVAGSNGSRGDGAGVGGNDGVDGGPTTPSTRPGASVIPGTSSGFAQWTRNARARGASASHVRRANNPLWGMEGGCALVREEKAYRMRSGVGGGTSSPILVPVSPRLGTPHILQV